MALNGEGAGVNPAVENNMVTTIGLLKAEQLTPDLGKTFVVTASQIQPFLIPGMNIIISGFSGALDLQEEIVSLLDNLAFLKGDISHSFKQE